MGTILLIVFILLLIGALPTWNHSRSWGYAPSGITALIVLVLLFMLLTGRL
jgi:fumarate reductase subunit D